MWTFLSSRNKRMRQQRARTATAALLSEYVFPKLTEETQARVDLAVIADYRANYLFAWWMRRSDLSADIAAIDRAYAMARLGIPTGVAELPWSELLAPRDTYRGFLASNRGARAFKRLHPATDEAIGLLQKHSVQIQEGLTHGYQWLEAQRSAAETHASEVLQPDAERAQ